MTGWPEWNFGATQIVARPPSVMDNSVYPRRLPSQRVFALSSGSTGSPPDDERMPRYLFGARSKSQNRSSVTTLHNQHP